MIIMRRTILVLAAVLVGLLFSAMVGLWLLIDEPLGDPSWFEPESEYPRWVRPSEPFTVTRGNNHDPILFREGDTYYLIVSHEREAAHLWKTARFSTLSTDWHLVDDRFQIAPRYEFDDGIKVGDTYFIYEGGVVYTYAGALEDSSGNWARSGTWPVAEADDVGVYWEDGVFHLFGEHGFFPFGPDGTSLAHFVSDSGLGDWVLIDGKAVDANPNGGFKYGIGDPTIAMIDGDYYLFSDIESLGNPYKVVAWRSADLNARFEYLGIAAAPQPGSGDWDNYRVQDCDIVYAPDIRRHAMACNMMDRDGIPGGDFSTMPDGSSRVLGIFMAPER